MCKRKTKINKLLAVIFICAVILSAAFTAILVRKYIKNKNRFDKDHPGEISFLVTEPEHISSDQYNIKFADNEMLIVVNPKINKKRVQNLAKAYNAKVVGRIEQTGDYQLQLDNSYSREELEALCTEIASEDIVESADINYLIEIQNDVAPYDINYGDEWEKEIKNNDSNIGWHINSINAPQAWEFCDEHKDIIKPVRIGVIDTGIDVKHEDLTNCAVDIYYDDFEDIRQKYHDGKLKYDDTAHGTHVFGTFAADANNTGGICGVYPYGRDNTYLASWTGCQNNYKENTVSAVSFKCCLAELILRNVKVINCSYGWANSYYEAFLFDGFEWMDQNIEYRKEKEEFYKCIADFLGDYLSRLLKAGKDFVIVVAAGNHSNKDVEIEFKNKNGEDDKCTVHCDWADAKCSSAYALIDGNTYSEVYDRIIVVGSVDKSKEISDFSDVGNRVDLFSPGEYIYSTVPDNKYDYTYSYIDDEGNEKTAVWGGTSMAAPQVAGVAAMVWSVNSRLKGDEVKDIIYRSSYDKNLEYKRFLNAYSAVVQAYESRWITKRRKNATTIQGGILGFVIDKETGEGIENATVHIIRKSTGDEHTATTDDAGHFEIFLPPDNYSINVTASGYEDYIWRDGTETFLNVGNEEVYYLEDWIYMEKPGTSSNIIWDDRYTNMASDVLPYLIENEWYPPDTTRVDNLSDYMAQYVVLETLRCVAFSIISPDNIDTSDNRIMPDNEGYYSYKTSDVIELVRLFAGRDITIDELKNSAEIKEEDENSDPHTVFIIDDENTKAMNIAAGLPTCNVKNVEIGENSVDIYYSIDWQGESGKTWKAHFIADNSGKPQFEYTEMVESTDTDTNPETNPGNNGFDKIEKNKEVIPRTRKCITAYYGYNNGIKWIENYDSKGVKTDIKDENGSLLTLYEYDSNGNCVREQWYDEGKDAGHAEYSYDAAGNCTWVYYKRPGGYDVEQTYEYDSAGNMIRKTHTMDGVTTIQENEYDANGNLICWIGTDGSGEKEYITWDYDANGFCIGGTHSVNLIVDSKIVVKTDNRGNITRQETVRDGEVLNSESFEYDDFGNKTKIYKNDNLIEENEYDDRGNRLKHIEYSGDNINQYWIYEYWD